MARNLTDEALPELAMREARLTHFDPLAGDVAAGVAVLCRRLINGSSWAEALGNAAIGRQDPTQRALSVVHAGSFDRGGYAPNVLAAAVHFVDRYGEFAVALDESFAFAGCGNYCPVLVGAIGGARWGASSVPIGRVRHADLLPRLNSVSHRLAAAWELGAVGVQPGERSECGAIGDLSRGRV
jgi:ADP-ribosylglycohydrolase